jgi:hypothetical protein
MSYRLDASVRGKSASRVHAHAHVTTKALSIFAWSDFENLFRRHKGVWGDCWCMYYRKPGPFDSKDYERNRNDKSLLVRLDRSHGILVYSNNEPVGWCQFGPGEELPRIDRKLGYHPTDKTHGGSLAYSSSAITGLELSRENLSRLP